MSNKKDMLERIADALDGGGDFGQGTVNEVGYLERIANVLENGGGSGGSGSASTFDILVDTSSYAPLQDVTFNQIKEAVLNGLQVRLIAQFGSMEGDDAAFYITFIPIYRMFTGVYCTVLFFNLDSDSDYHGMLTYEAKSADTPLHRASEAGEPV